MAYPETVTLIRSMRGAPAVILLTLLFTGRSITNKEFQLITGYTDKPVATALGVLETLGLAQNNGRYAGWSFPLSKQLPLFHHYPAVSHPSSPSSRISISANVESQPIDVDYWLLRAGISPNSKKFSELKAADLDELYVKAWVLQYEWWRKERNSSSLAVIDGRRNFSVGTLIRILQDGDNAPAMRCQDCHSILPCYCDVIFR